MDAIDLNISDGVTLAVPATLQSITTYVLLEQEGWFEKELGFVRHWLRSGMTVIDIGANLGAYSLPMSRLVGRTGHVFAYEPGSEARGFLQRSRQRNGADNLEILPFALSDCRREGRLIFGGSTELNALGGERGAGETVLITSLDDEDVARGFPPPDFVKIDAEGEEERILTGARNFLSRHSPLIMFEIRAGDKTNEPLRSLFSALGYRLFRQLGGAPILVPDFPQQELDAFELNLFAAKPDRVRSLSEQGVLVDEFPAWAPTAEDCDYADSFWKDQTFAPFFAVSGNGTVADVGYRNALAAYAAWRAAQRPTAVRCAALALALRGLRAICRRHPTPGRLSTWARVAWESGARGESVTVLQRMLQTQGNEQGRLDEPFWPAAARFDNIAPGKQPMNWFSGALAEQYEKTYSFSSVFFGASPVLQWLREQTFASTEMERRHVLVAARAGLRPPIPARLCEAAPDHLNAEVWLAGKVPGTIAGT